jgi:hypothetical protein
VLLVSLAHACVCMVDESGVGVVDVMHMELVIQDFENINGGIEGKYEHCLLHEICRCCIFILCKMSVTDLQ